MQMPIGEAFGHVSEGRLEGVLSSGDGAAGQRLCEHLRCFYDIRYATPISFAVINAELYHDISIDQRRLVDEASKTVERSLWCDLDRRVRQNHSHMIAAGIQIFPEVEAKLKQALWEGGHRAINHWEQGECGKTASILGEYFPSPQGR